MKSYKAYTYTCEAHAVGEHVRDVGDGERDLLAGMAAAVPHALNCWIRGCQNELSQVRLVSALPATTYLEYEHLSTQEDVRNQIRECEGKHVQQAIYSTFHDALTQVCFGCRKVRSSIRALPATEPAQPETCGEMAPLGNFHGTVCTQPAGHEGRHRDGGASWLPVAQPEEER